MPDIEEYVGLAVLEVFVGGQSIGIHDVFRSKSTEFYIPADALYSTLNKSSIDRLVQEQIAATADDVTVVPVGVELPPTDWVPLVAVGNLTEDPQALTLSITPFARYLKPNVTNATEEDEQFDDHFSFNTRYNLTGTRRDSSTGRRDSLFGRFDFFGNTDSNVRFNNEMFISSTPSTVFGDSPSKVYRGRSQAYIKTDFDTYKYIGFGDHQISGSLFSGGINYGGITVSNYRSAYETDAEGTRFVFQGVAREASTVELYINDRLVSRDDLPPSTYVVDQVLPDKPSQARIVVTDLDGNSEVITRDLYPAEGLVTQGRHLFNAHFGAVRTGENDYGGLTVAGNGQYGVTPSLTFNYSVESIRSQQVLTLGTRAGTFLGQIGFDGGVSRDGRDKENVDFGSTARIYWRNTFDIGRQFSTGVTISVNDDYLPPLNQNTIGDTVTAYLGSSLPLLNGFTFGYGAQTVYSNNVSASTLSSTFSKGGFYVGFSSTYVDRRDGNETALFASVGYTPRQRRSRVYGTYNVSEAREASRVQLSGRLGDTRNQSGYYSVVAGKSRSNQRSSDTYGLFGSTRFGPVSTSLSAYRNNGLDSTRLTVSGTASLSQFGLNFIPTLGSDFGLTVLEAPDESIDAGLGASTHKIERGESVTVATYGKRHQAVRVDPTNLQLGWSPQPVESVKVRPWRIAERQIRISPPGFFLQFPELKKGSKVTVNGKSFELYPHGVFVDNPRLVGNEISWDTGSVVLDLERPSDVDDPDHYSVTNKKVELLEK